MNNELKSAWFTLVVISVALLACLVVGIMFGLGPAFAPLGMLGLLGFTPLIFRRRKGELGCDERDIDVAKKATLVGTMISYLSIVLGGMGIWFVQFYRGVEMISINVLPLLVMTAAITLMLGRSLFIIAQYSRKALGSDE
jgi:hypothetical protein